MMFRSRGRRVWLGPIMWLPHWIGGIFIVAIMIMEWPIMHWWVFTPVLFAGLVGLLVQKISGL